MRLMMEDNDDAKDAKDNDDDRYYTRRLPDGLVHASQVSDDITFQRDDSDEAKVQSLSYFFPVDTKVFVKVLKCEEDPARGWKVSLSMKIVNQETGEDNDPENKKDVFNKSPNNAPSASFEADLFGVYKGKVSSIKPYGVFVNLENTRTSALVHVSEISEHLRFSRGDTDKDKVMGIEGVLSVGESCFVKIIEMKPPESERDRMKLSGSIRLVDQKSGEDLDPENMKLRERQRQVVETMPPAEDLTRNPSAQTRAKKCNQAASSVGTRKSRCQRAKQKCVRFCRRCRRRPKAPTKSGRLFQA